MVGRTPRPPRSTRRQRLLALPIVLVAAGLLAFGCSSGSGPSPSAQARIRPPSSTSPTAPAATSTSTTVVPSAAGQPPLVPATGAYLGAWINPSPGHSEISQLPGFVASVGRTPSILSLYTAWAKPAPIAHMQTIVEHGAIPLVSWGCAPTAAVASGQYDQLITSYALALKSFGHPVLLRWSWEMNLKVPKDVACIGTNGPAGFVAAWIHVWTIFHRVGATNVSFVWCPGISGGLTELGQYFPGAAYVDWIGVDGYDRKGQGAQAFSQLFGAWYAAYAGYGKPLMVGETGATATDQAAYLQGIGSALPSQFPDIKALVYFDATGPAAVWALTPEGLQAYGQLARSPYFAP